MKGQSLLGIAILWFFVTSCDGLNLDPSVCDDDNKAVIDVFNNSFCAPDLSVDGEAVTEAMQPFTTQSVELDAGEVDILLTVDMNSPCTPLNKMVTVACGDHTQVEFRQVCDEDNKAVITVVNNAVCTPDVSVDGDNIAADMGILATQSVEVDAGEIDIEFTLALISLCTAFDTTVTVACGDSVSVEFTGE